MIQFVKLLFDCVWQLFSIKWPGFDFPIGYAFLGVALSVVVLRLCGVVLGLGIGNASMDFGSSSEGRAFSFGSPGPRLGTGSQQQLLLSSNPRKDDEF